MTYSVVMGEGKNAKMVWVSDNPEQDEVPMELDSIKVKLWKLEKENEYLVNLVKELTEDMKALMDCNIEQNQRLMTIENSLKGRKNLKEMIKG